MTTTPLGSPIRRKEDHRFITGRGRYVEDLRVPRMLHAAFVRSPHAHARVKRIDAEAARALPGVQGIFTVHDLPECAGHIPPSIAAPAGFHVAPQPVFADPVARYAGDVVAVVVAEEAYQAADGAEAVAVEYTPLPVVADLQAAQQPDAARVFPSWPGNTAGVSSATVGDPAAGAGEADVIVEARLGLGRVAGAPIEPRGLLVVPRGGDGRLTVFVPSQSPYSLRSAIAGALGLPDEQVRVLVTDTGGGFGIKGHTYSEDVIVAAVARRLDRPVKWTETRREHFLTGSPDRGQQHTARLGLKRDGRSTVT